MDRRRTRLQPEKSRGRTPVGFLPAVASALFRRNGVRTVAFRLTKIGDSLALVLDRSVLEAARIDASTPLEIFTNGELLVIAPLRGSRRAEKIREAIEDMNRRYCSVFRRLAE